MGKNKYLEEKTQSDEEETNVDSTSFFDYLLGMNYWKISDEEMTRLEAEKDKKQRELERIKAQDWRKLWEIELDAFLDEYHRQEEKLQKEEIEANKQNVDKVQPSQRGTRIVPDYSAPVHYPKSKRNEMDEDVLVDEEVDLQQLENTDE
ncbi:unnamed protein product [Bursaphelenchus okinawaensis]|uniref:DNA topoisomerase (ATP-hydrolyzing) n=1 Tax=Bursaphelenchus okinawaensis TaxID=465554 RepID=A0A811KQS8_9BILA|nr:unnamed protein product [Bursaphelenchus okinawaensis]CAG9110852.1 unnamed protein product [Bursaphelenchus okinawaensis]